MASSIPEEVQRLVYQHLPTMDHVELLLFLVRSGAESRSVPEILARVTTHADTAESKLGELVEAGLVAANDEGGIRRYRYAPAGLRQRLAVEGLTEAYDTRPVSLIRIIYERPPDAAQKFADAFLFRKPKE